MNNSTAIIHADGGSRGNPGPAGIGATLELDGNMIGSVSETIGIATNNVAEYTALIKILEKALELGVQNVEVRMDSELVVKQMLGLYRVKHDGLIPLFKSAKALSEKFRSFDIKHVRREQNKNADRLANQAMDLLK